MWSKEPLIFSVTITQKYLFCKVKFSIIQMTTDAQMHKGYKEWELTYFW